MFQYVAVCCSVLQPLYLRVWHDLFYRTDGELVAGCCSMLQRDAAASFTCVTLDVLQGG